MFAILPFIFLFVMIAWPLIEVFKLLMTDFNGTLFQVLAEPYYQKRLWMSVIQAILTVIASILLGVPLAFIVAYRQFKGRDWFLRLLMLPFVLPSLVVALSFLSLYGAQGWFGLNGQGQLWLVILANVFYNETIVLRFVYNALGRLDPNWLAAARSLGSSPSRVIWKVVLPYLWPSILASACLVFLYSFLTFGISLLLGGMQFATLEVEIYHLALQRLELSEASVLILLQTSLGLAVALIEVKWMQRWRLPFLKLQARQPTAALLPWQGVWVYLHAAFLLLPIICIFLQSVSLDGQFTWLAYQQLFNNDTQGLTSLWDGVCNTLMLATYSTMASLILGGLQAFWVWRTQSVLSRICLSLPLFVSPVGLAVGYLMAYPSLAGNAYLLVAVYVLAGYPLLARSLLLGLEGLPTVYLNTAATLGSSSLSRVKKIMLPLLKPALKTGLLLALVAALGEFTATLVLARPEWATLTVAIYERLNYPGEIIYAQAMGLATVLMCLTLMCFGPLEWGIRR